MLKLASTHAGCFDLKPHIATFRLGYVFYFFFYKQQHIFNKFANVFFRDCTRDCCCCCRPECHTHIHTYVIDKQTDRFIVKGDLLQFVCSSEVGGAISTHLHRHVQIFFSFVGQHMYAGVLGWCQTKKKMEENETLGGVLQLPFT